MWRRKNRGAAMGNNLRQKINQMPRRVTIPPAWGCLGLAAISGLLLVAATTAAEPIAFRSGKELSETLARRVGFEISGDPRRDALQRIATQFHIGLFLDRRIDPDAPVSYRTQNDPLGTALEGMASQFNAAVTWLGPIGYIGPASEAKKLQTVRALAHQQIGVFPESVKQRLLQPQALRWDRLTTPANIVEDIANSYQLQWKYPERLPHDLWGSGQLPATDCATQLTVILAGFGDMPQFNDAGKTLESMPIEDQVKIRRSYAVDISQHDQVLQDWKRKFPQAEIQQAGKQLIVNARVEEHWQIDPSMKPTDTPGQKLPVIGSKGRQVYTLRVEAPMEAILKALASQTGLELVWQRREIKVAGIDVQQVVKLDVQQAPLEDLLSQLLQPTGLTFLRKGNQLTITALEKEK